MCYSNMRVDSCERFQRCRSMPILRSLFHRHRWWSWFVLATLRVAVVVEGICVAPHLHRLPPTVSNPFTNSGDGFGRTDGSGLHVGPGCFTHQFEPGPDSQ
ncbi:hypothetical protein Goari_005560, partial [Gossypium aridum]|nr:hypothetical protein [Gossypium aridum]